jgi:hypothetical protein
MTWRIDVLKHRWTAALMVGVVLFCGRAARAQAAPDAALAADIQKLLDLTKASQLGTQMASLVSQQVIQGLKQSQPNMPPRAAEVIQQFLGEQFAIAFSASSPDGMMPKLVAVYANHFTQQDIRGLIAFYNTDLGQKLINQTPLIVSESATVGQEWAAQHMPDMLAALERKLRADGLVK